MMGLQQMETKADRIRRLLTANKLSVNKLAKMLDCYPNSIHQWLKGDTQPNDMYIKKMAEIFGVEPEYIWGGRNPITDDVEGIAYKYASLSQRDKDVVASVIASLKPVKKNGNSNGH